MDLKGYSHLPMWSSENVVFEPQFKNFFNLKILKSGPYNQALYNLSTYRNWSKTNNDEFVNFYFLVVCTDKRKNNKYYLPKMNRSYIAISSDSLQGLELVSSLHSRAKNRLAMFAISCMNFQPYIILITTRILKKRSKV